MKTTFFIKTALLALSAALFAPFASATTVSISFSGSDSVGDSYSGILTGSPDSHILGAYDIRDISGTVDRVPTGSTTIDSSASFFFGPWNPAHPVASPGNIYGFDDIYYSGTGDSDGQPLDSNGLLIVLTGGVQVNIFCSGPQCFFDEHDGLPSPISGSFNATVNPNLVPEPASLILFGTGALGLAGVVRRRLSA